MSIWNRVASPSEGEQGSQFVDRLIWSLRFSFRSVRSNLLFSAVAISTLALGIGANAIIFSVVNSVLLKSLPYPDSDRIYCVRTVIQKLTHVYPDFPVNPRHFEEWKRGCTSCESMALFRNAEFNLEGAGAPQRAEGLLASAELLPMLGIRMQLGRTFSASENLPGVNRVIVISDELWRRDFGADPNVVGKKVTWNQVPVEIIGVLPPNFRFPKGDELGAVSTLPDHVDAIRPLVIDLSQVSLAGDFGFAALVKLKRGVPLQQAVTEMSTPVQDFSRQTGKEMSVRLYDLKDRMTGSVRAPLFLLLGAAIALLLIVCVNLGNLMMSRTAVRQRDWALRFALGARKADVATQALAESLTLSMFGGALGAAVAVAGLRILSQHAIAVLPRIDEIALDWQMPLCIIVLSTIAGSLCGLVPLWRTLSINPSSVIRTGSLSLSQSPRERRARQLLVCCEAGLSMALGIAAGLLVVSFVRMLKVDKGFDSDRVYTFQVALSEGRYTFDRRNQFYDSLVEKLGTTHDIRAVGLTSYLPLQGETWVNQLRRKGDSEGVQANYRFVSSGYFPTIGIHLKSGRYFEQSDRGRPIAILSERAAHQLYPNESPIGREISDNNQSNPNYLSIVGVVSDVKTSGLESEAPLIVYLQFSQLAPSNASCVVRVTGDDPGLAASMRSIVSSVDKTVPLYRFSSMSQIIDGAVANRKLETLLAGSFAIGGVLLACLGIFGVVSYSVSRRTAEIALRLALGATHSDVLRVIVKQSMQPVVIGVGCGVFIAAILGKFLSSELYAVSPWDPTVFSSVGLMILGAALAASYWPARRVLSVDPNTALRSE